MLTPLQFLSLRNNRVKMIKIVHRNLPGVSNMANQGRIILQNYCVCNLLIVSGLAKKKKKKKNHQLTSVVQGRVCCLVLSREPHSAVKCTFVLDVGLEIPCSYIIYLYQGRKKNQLSSPRLNISLENLLH